MRHFMLLLAVLSLAAPAAAQSFQSAWPENIERTWIGPEFWANRLQDWRIAGGRLECLEGAPGKPMRTVHLLTRRISAGDGEFALSVRLGLIEPADGSAPQAAAGFLIGVGPDIDYRAAALVHHGSGPGGGLFAGIDGAGRLFFRDNTAPGKAGPGAAAPAAPDASAAAPRDVELRLAAKPATGGKAALTLSSHDPTSGKQLASVTQEVDAARLAGGLALVSHPGGGKPARFWFKDWKTSGPRVEAHDDRTAGPILCTQYTLSGGVLKMTAQMMPLGPADTQDVRLEVQKDGAWKQVATAKIIAPGWTAPFRVENWDATKDTPYRVIYDLKQPGGGAKTCTWAGTVRRDPVEKPVLVIAGFTGNHNVAGGVDRPQFSWDNAHLWFPHNEVARHVGKHDPDVLFFSGDQVYEGASPTSPDTAHIYLDYMYKWYLWCWAFGDLARGRPCLSTPDDHDVFQGNLWGAGGRATEKDDKGGYVHPAGFVKMVERTQSSHLPDPPDAAPVAQGIGVYYSAMTYGRVSFAVIEDRKFKSGPNGLAPATTTGRADHENRADFDAKTADVPGAELLGPRQEKFLREWAADWRGADMKIELSQTVYANAATLHGGNLQRLRCDYDACGWPQSGRARALDALRRGFAFMLNGDQHLATIIHHGIDDWGDAGWSFCVPSIANFYPRAWVPLAPDPNRPAGLPDYCGRFRDGFDNPITVWAATNPGTPQGREPAALHDRMPGYGIVRMNKVDQTITMECWPRYADPTDPATGRQYPGWPKTIGMEDNYGRKAAAYLPTLAVKGMERPVVQVIDEKNGEIVYTLRIKAATFRPKVFREGTYTVKVGEPGTDRMKTVKGVASLAAGEEKTLPVEF